MSTRITPRRSSHSKRRRSAARRGFTLVEVIVVVTVIALLAVLAINRLVAMFGQSQVGIAKAQAAKIHNALTGYLIDTGQPMAEDGFDLSVLTLRPGNGGGPNGPYLPKVTDVNDPWGNQFIVRVPGEVNADWDIVSFGFDGAPGGEGPSQDVTQ